MNGERRKVYVRAMSLILDTPARPKPKPGILDIQPYVGGKSKIEGVVHPIKLSSNENVLGCSPGGGGGV